MEIEGTLFTIGAEQLSKGLRPVKVTPKNNGYLVTCNGAVGLDEMLAAVNHLTKMDTSVVTDAFPYPQFFVLTNMLLLCGKTKIYEYVSGSWVLKLTVTEGSTWSVVDFFDYVYLSNGVVAVIRNAASKVYSTTTTLPAAKAMCNFNGQVVVGNYV